MKQLCFSLSLVATLIIACSNSEPTKQTSQKTAQETDKTEQHLQTTEEVASTTPVTEKASGPLTTNALEQPTEKMPVKEEVTQSTTTNTNPVENIQKTNPTTAKTVVEPIEEVVEEVLPVAATPAPIAKEPVMEEKLVEKVVEAPKTVLNHDAFDQLLRKYVNSSGGVDYNGFKKDKKALAAYLESLKKNTPQSSWSKNKEMAYWINLYNAFTIYTIVEKYPVSSIMDLEGGKIWDKKTIVIGRETLTLNKIEKDKLLKRFKEPRVHFAVNCAAASCPPLLNKAWTEDNVQRYFSKQTKAFINNSKYNSISAKSLEISQIFNWYAGDFGGSDKIVAYFQKYASTEISSNAKVKFKEYNWKLNKQ